MKLIELKKLIQEELSEVDAEVITGDETTLELDAMAGRYWKKCLKRINRITEQVAEGLIAKMYPVIRPQFEKISGHDLKSLIIVFLQHGMLIERTSMEIMMSKIRKGEHYG